MLRLFDFDNPFFRPLWIRLLVVGFTACWTVFEFSMGSPFWAILFAALTAVSFYGLFIAFNPREPEASKDKRS